MGVRQQNGCFDTHTFIQFSTYDAYNALSDCAEAPTMFWHRGCPVAAVMGADAGVQVKVDLIRGPFARKVRHVEYALLRLKSQGRVQDFSQGRVPGDGLVLEYY